MSLNRTVISGNLTRDMEIRTTASGTAVGSFGIAVNDRVKNGDSWEDRPNFFDCTMFGKRAESLAQYLTKGTKACIEGKLRYSQWERDGQKRSKVEIIVEEVELMGQKQGSESRRNDRYSAPETEVVETTYYDNDCPF